MLVRIDFSLPPGVRVTDRSVGMRDKHSTSKRPPVPEADLSDLGWWIEVWYFVIQVENGQKEKEMVFCGFVVLLCLASNSYSSHPLPQPLETEIIAIARRP